MLAKKVRSRIVFSIIIVFFTSIVLYITFKSLEENVVYFYSPTDIYNENFTLTKEKIRVGGLVKEKSINKKETLINFIITDLKNEIIISYKGLVPNLFSEGKGVIAEGNLIDKKYFVAEKIIAKHDENYMPPEIKSSLEKSE